MKNISNVYGLHQFKVYPFVESITQNLRGAQYKWKIGDASHPPLSRTPSINAQCRSIRSMPIEIMALIRNASQCRSLPINADQFPSIDRHLSELIYIGINARILIGIDWHWALIGGVLIKLLILRSIELSKWGLALFWATQWRHSSTPTESSWVYFMQVYIFIWWRLYQLRNCWCRVLKEFNSL